MILGLTAFVAIYVYADKKHGDRSAAASALIADISRAQEIITEIKKLNYWKFDQKKILTENNWNNFRHLFVKEFSSDDLKSFDQFFDGCVDIDISNERNDYLWRQNIVAKINIISVTALEERSTDTTDQKSERAKKVADMASNQFMFQVAATHEKILEVVRSIKYLSDTQGFKELDKFVAYSKKNLFSKIIEIIFK